MNKNVAKNPIKTKSKPKIEILLLHNSDDNVLIQNSLNNLVVSGLSSSSNIETIFSYLWYISQA